MTDGGNCSLSGLLPGSAHAPMTGPASVKRSTCHRTNLPRRVCLPSLALSPPGPRAEPLSAVAGLPGSVTISGRASSTVRTSGSDGATAALAQKLEFVDATLSTALNCSFVNLSVSA